MPNSTTTSPSSDPFENPDENAKRLLTAAERIMLAIAADPAINLNHPVDMLALHLLGPAMQRAMGMTEADLAEANFNILTIAKDLDLDILRALLRQASR